ncbi:MAG: hypothetical protein R6U96_01880 [Promethearchaeia archaeon]
MYKYLKAVDNSYKHKNIFSNKYNGKISRLQYEDFLTSNSILIVEKMTQKKSGPISNSGEKSEEWRSTRVENAPPDLFDPDQPRLGRRESEPHSTEVTYLHDVLKTNFPNGRVFWDLHHYFIAPKGALKGKKIDIQFDISFFKKLSVSYALPSYDATKYEGKVPDIAINILSKSTWRADLSEHVEACKDLSIPVYVIFSPYLVTSKRYAPPFLRAYILQENGSYKQKELRSITIKEKNGEIDENHIIDISDKLPFRLGLMQLQQRYLGGKQIYRLIIIDQSKPKILLTRREKELKEAKKKIKEVKKKAENAKKEAENANKEAENAKKEAEKLRKELQKYQDKFGKLD